MKTVGIIAEFNPFHNGHAHIINEIKRGGDTVVCALSGNFVQRGDVAILKKSDRVKAALSAGADVAVEIPSVYSMSTAQNFALAGVWQLYNMGCEKIVFGSESGDINSISKTAEILSGDKFSRELSNLLKSGETFAKSREKAAGICGADISLLNSPNDNLGIEYILAAKRLKLKIEFEAVKRTGALHDAAPTLNIASGSYIRNLLLNGDFESAKKYVPQYVYPFLNEENIADIKRIEKAILGILRTKKKEDFKNLPDISEGIENRLFEAIKSSSSLDELYENIKSKRYTLARVRRLVLSAALGFDDSFFLVPPPYTRILGASEKGLLTLKNAVSSSPVVIKPSDIDGLDLKSIKLFKFECFATDIYALAFKTPRPTAEEYTMKFIKKDNLKI